LTGNLVNSSHSHFSNLVWFGNALLFIPNSLIQFDLASFQRGITSQDRNSKRFDNLLIIRYN